jgi:hypothetical protein
MLIDDIGDQKGTKGRFDKFAGNFIVEEQDTIADGIAVDDKIVIFDGSIFIGDGLTTLSNGMPIGEVARSHDHVTTISQLTKSSIKGDVIRTVESPTNRVHNIGLQIGKSIDI